jgi:mRNA-degrading endonuclease toxin of MazEF toxin-antitoxin module
MAMTVKREKVIELAKTMPAVDKSRIVKKIGQLSKDDMKEVDAAIWERLKPINVESET